MDLLEPFKLRQFWVKQDVMGISSYYSYCQSIVRWKRAFLFFAPDVRCQIDTLERDHRRMCQNFLPMCDKADFFSDRELAFDILIVLYDDVRSLKSLDTVNPAAADHLQSVLDNHLRICCALWFATNYTIEDLCKSGRMLIRAQCLNSMPETSKILPPQHHGCLSKIWETLTDVISCHTQCLKTKPESDDTHYNSHKRSGIPRCFCGWIVDCLPPGFLTIFGYTTSSLSHAFHEQNDFKDLNRTFSNLFKIPITNPDSQFCFKVKSVIRHAITLSLRLWFESLVVATNSDRLNNLPEDFQRMCAKLERPKVMIFIIVIGIQLYTRFIIWPIVEYQEKTGPHKGGYSLHPELETWAKENKFGRQVGEFISECVCDMMEGRNRYFVQLSSRQSATTQ
jgi:hypothetical protein